MPTYTLEQLTTLTEAISQGATKVKYGDKEVEYRSLKEMQTLLHIIKDDLGLNGDTTGNRGRRYAEFSKGLE